MKNVYFLMLLLALSQTVFAQTFEISAEIRPRFEYRHGYKTLAVDTLDAAAFVSQRTRLNVNFESEKINAFVSLQDVRVWGDVATLNVADNNGTTIHQAWAELLLSKQFTLKLGRQEISYDDERIFGSVGWAQQARSHDAFLAIYKPNDNNHFELGLALNAEAETLFETDYNINNYKAFQYVWYHTKMSDLGLSFLVLNNGLAYDDNGGQKVAYNQTFGTRATFSKNQLKADASLYFQTGKLAKSVVSAYNAAANVYYEISASFNAGLGAEYLSGTDMNSIDSKLKSFNPWFGTNHKFNGWMDYFYVGNHINSVGLLDVNATIAYKKNKFSAKLIPHMFSAAATVVDDTGNKMSNGLGTELDLVLNYNWTKDVSFQAGYSHLFATETMEVLKGGNRNANNNWAWAMITVKPSLFKTTIRKD